MENKNYYVDLSVRSIIDKAWGYTKKHFLPLLLILLLEYMVIQLSGSLYYGDYMSAMIESGGVMSEQQWLENSNPAELMDMLGKMMLLAFICWLVKVYLDLVKYRMLISAVETDEVDMTARFKDGTRGYLNFLLCSFLFAIVVGFGALCCIILGIFLGIRFMFVPVIAAQNPDLGFSNVFSRSWKITEGHFFELLLLGIVVVLLVFVGLCACCVGIIPVAIVSEFMYIETYYRLVGGKDDGRKEDTHNNKNSNTEYNNGYTRGYSK